MTSTVKLDDDKKRKLEEFLARLFIEKGKKVALQDALGLAVERALDDEEFLDELADLPPLEEDAAWKMLKEPKHWGLKDSSKDIDEHLYGR